MSGSRRDSRIFLSPPWCGGSERANVSAAFDSGYVAPCGPMADAFERRIAAHCGVPSAAALSSGTAALDLIFDMLGVGRGDTVVCSDLTFIASAAPAVHRGAAPAFVDSDPATGQISIPLLRKAVAELRPKCVVATDLYGECCDYDALEAVCAEAGAALVCDSAEAFGSKWKDRPAGTAGFAGVFSFNGNKIVTTGGGGTLVSRDPAVVERARWLSQQAREPFPWYEHARTGYNYRMPNLSAAVGLGQLDAFPEILARKRAIFDFYRKAFPALEPFPCHPDSFPTHWLSVFLFPSQAERDDAAARCAAHGIETRPVWKPMHLQPVFKDAAAFGGETSADFFARGICLPSGAGLDAESLERIRGVLGGG